MAETIEERYKDSLQNKKIPILILDNKWHQLFAADKKTRTIKKLEAECKNLLQRQGKLGNEIKEMKVLKKNLLQEIRDNMEAAENDSALQKKQEKNQKYILEINDKVEQYEDELLELPYELERVNHQLMLETLQVFYDRIKHNEAIIDEIVEWVRKIREQVKDNMVKKTTLEEYNMMIYGYLHDVLGADILNTFDFKYLKKAQETQETQENSQL